MCLSLPTQATSQSKSLDAKAKDSGSVQDPGTTGCEVRWAERTVVGLNDDVSKVRRVTGHGSGRCEKPLNLASMRLEGG